jgi:hypothetical protein
MDKIVAESSLWELGRHDEDVAFELVFYRPFGQASPVTADTPPGYPSWIEWQFKPQQYYVTADFDQSQLDLLAAPPDPTQCHGVSDAAGPSTVTASSEGDDDSPLWNMFFAHSVNEKGGRVGGKEIGSKNGRSSGDESGNGVRNSSSNSIAAPPPEAEATLPAPCGGSGALLSPAAAVGDPDFCESETVETGIATVLATGIATVLATDVDHESGPDETEPTSAAYPTLSAMFSMTPIQAAANAQGHNAGNASEKTEEGSSMDESSSMESLMYR